MPLRAGDRLGPYQVTGELGAGGMGIVLRATDTQLGRDVALKILPDAFATDPDRLARFQREAQVLASLNHPNIAQIYGIEEDKADGTRALVLELVDGPTLADRIAQGAMAIEDALPIARQIAEALEAAHEAGVIHRDLKPANIKVREDGTVKVLDFGLAKALDTAPEGDPSQSPTMTDVATVAGVILGTAAYMSPEQAKGRAVDQRADIWAFGVVLYEMVTGRRAFRGDDNADVRASVLRAAIDWDLLPTSAPVRLRRALGVCLQRDPKHRAHAIADVRLTLEGTFESPGPAPTRDSPAPPWWQRPLPAAAAAILLVIMTVLVVRSLDTPAESLRGVSRFSFSVPEVSLHAMTMSPDGTLVVYSSLRDGDDQLFVRARGQFDAVPLRGTEGGTHPFFSPDGLSIGFSTADELKRVPVDGGVPTTLCALDAHRGATWGPNGSIVFAPRNTPEIRGLMQVPASGGEPQPLTSPPVDDGRHAWPSFTPDGRAVLFTTGPDSPLASKRVAVLTLESGAERILTAGTGAQFVTPSHIVFGRQGSLWAAPFDLRGLVLTGDPAPAVEGVAVGPRNGIAHFAVANDGTLAYRAVESASADPTRALVWVDRQGVADPIAIPRRAYRTPRLSPDGTRAAVAIGDIDDPDNLDVWVADLERRTLSRVTTDPGRDQFPMWMDDGRRIAFESDRDGTLGVHVTDADGRGDDTRLFAMENSNTVNPRAWLPDEQGLVFVFRTSAGGYTHDIGVASVDEGTWEPLVSTSATEFSASLSPDGRWLAYASDETGFFEVYLEPLGRDGGRQQISTSGGTAPVWSPQGGELFYRDSSGAMMAVPIETTPALALGIPTLLFEGQYFLETGRVYAERHYDADPSGDRFLMVTSAADPAPPPINVVLNWVDELEERVPAN